MTHHVNYLDGSPVVRSGGSNAAGFPKVTVFENVFDATRRPLDGDDTVDVLTIPAGTYVLKVFVHVEVADVEDAHTFNVGDAADRDGWVAAAPLAVARIMGAGDYAADTGALVGKFYATATPLSIEATTAEAMTTARVRVIAFGVSIG